VFHFTVQVTDGLGNTASRAMSMTVNPSLTISTAALPAITRGQYEILTLHGLGGHDASYAWNITSGSLPPGMVLSSAGSPFTILYGIPTAVGNYNFTIQVMDALSNAASKSLQVGVYEAGTIISVAGDGTTYLPGGPNGDGSLATTAQLNSPQGLAFDSQGNIYIGERSGYRVRKVDAQTGIIATFAGNGMQGAAGGPDSIFPPPSTRLATSAKFAGITDVKVDAQDNVWILD
jgi:hypothetical protein